MVPRDTTTGTVFEDMLALALSHGGYEAQKQVVVGERLGGRKHKVDWIATAPNGDKFIISVKWQQTSGTAEQKVPFELLCLIDTVSKGSGDYKRAYLVLGGGGWTLRDWYIGDGLREFLIPYEDYVDIISGEAFISIANQGKL